MNTAPSARQVDEPALAGARVVVVTGGHLSTCPRMLKAADALAWAGADVRVVSARFLDWAIDADAEARRTRDWAWDVIDYSWGSGRTLRLWSGLRMRAANIAVGALGPTRAPLFLTGRAYSRIHPELFAAALRKPADLIYAGTAGALAAAALAAKRARVPYALDLEDFHSDEHGGTAPDRDAIASAIERQVLSAASFLTTSSEPMQAAYRERYGVSPTVIHNVFPLAPVPRARERSRGSPLRLYWFSQTVGPDRGIEEVIRASGAAGIPCELHLRGNPVGGYVDQLRSMQREAAPRLTVVHHPPAAPDEMTRLCEGYDIGLATEIPNSGNKQVCLSNKIFTYLAGGLAVLCSDTPAQRAFATQVEQAVRVYPSGDVPGLAVCLREWGNHPEALATARSAASAAARRRWHWEHACERGALIGAFRRALGQ